MNFLTVLVSFFILTSIGFGQQLKSDKNNLRYPNELDGFKLIRDERLKNLIPGITAAKEIREVESSLQEDKIGDCEHCLFNKDWNVYFTQIDTREGNLDSIQFYPRKRIPFSRVRFSKQFKKSRMGISDNDIGDCIVYEDKYGLSYVIVNDSGNEKLKKGDLYYIEYGVPQ